MKLKNTFILLGTLFLSAFIIIGSPFEFRVLTHQRIAIIIFALLVILLFFRIIKSLREQSNKILKTSGMVLISILGLIYVFIGLMYIPEAVSGNSRQWEDLFLYTNENGEKVYAQYQENGSLPQSRDMKTYYEFENGNRISLITSNFEPDETWKEEDLRSDFQP